MLPVSCLLATAILLQAAAAPMSKSSRKYLDHALDIIQNHSLMRETDWKGLRANALKQAAGAQKPADTYAAIRAALAAIKDHHSFFITPQEAQAMAHGSAARWA